MRAAAGLPLALSHGPYRAEIVTVGACLRVLTRDGVDLVAGTPSGEICANFRGAVLMPWPNRVGDGAYDFDGHAHQLALSEPARRNALHGLAHWVAWTVAEHTGDRVVLRHELPAQVGYPWSLDLEVDYALGDDGLTISLTATNASGSPAPYGTGLHPYLTVGRRVDECVLTLPADTRCEMSDRGLPSPATSVDGTAYDFREPHVIGDLELDHPFGGVAAGSTAVLADPDSGREVRLTVGDGLGWLHVFTGDPLPWGVRESLAVEPTTGPPDAFRSGIDLIVLEPGDTHTVSFTITGS
ncbi:aldose 1-epimerase family protein [Nocardioides sp. YIM 152315]|uniref:aldose 1-epimerase family protein n=1 Tax=Nocardioides sp. YIM 152315 TaxID=3031760 RepID=UPI0023DA8D45|nr:aldose 1-epimerase family protein [Nocardioides sp. YIM 152315]MDF1605182.1 aldose 1-epimerase family protein [Nocardioides sp. YIM 152315]